MRMKGKLAMAAMIAAGSMTSGCATIVHGGPRSIPITSSPPGAMVSIYDRDGNLFTKQATPFTAVLPTKYGYFKGQTYRLAFDLNGYQPAESNLTSSVSGWYFGNLAFGGLIGMLAVDPVTGAMYNFAPENINQVLTPRAADAN